jgi:hypothetical protein
VSIAGTLTPGELRFLGFKVIGKLFEYTETDEDDTKRHLAEPFVSQLDRDDFPEYYEIIKGVLRGLSSCWAMSTQGLLQFQKHGFQATSHCFADGRDFSQVIAKLDKGAYSDIHSFESDLNLIFNNAKVRRPPKSSSGT